MGIPDLPQEILIDIFSRLPTKSVGKCRCLSKQWRTQLSTPQFIKSHLTRKPHQQNLILISPSGRLHLITAITNDTVSRKLESPCYWNQVMGSCDGLVLLENEEEEKFLLNPITLQQVKLPDPPLASNEQESVSNYGLGHDSSTDDYKVVRLSFHDDDLDTFESVDTFVDVYCGKSGVWKRVENSPYDHIFACLRFSPGAFVDGAIHWLATSREAGYRYVIAAFDLADEVFHEIPAPKEVDVEKFVSGSPSYLVALGGCLCVIDFRANNPVDVWVMKEYGLVESWTKFDIRVNGDYERFLLPLCFMGDDNEEVVCLTEEESLVVYNLNEGNWRDMMADGVRSEFVHGGTFVESLISPAFSIT